MRNPPAPVSVARLIYALIQVPDHAIGSTPSAAGFAAMRKAFQPSGGLARAADLAHQLQLRRRGDPASLARMIDGGEACACEWERVLWLPMFQFDAHELALRQDARMAVEELGNELHGWALAAWFARPNAWLADHRPADMLHVSPRMVLEAACADRYIAAM